MAKTRRVLMALTLFALASAPAHAALLSRAGGQAYYDDVLDVTWVADASLAATLTFGVAGIGPNGTMSWPKAGEWISAMNAAGYLGQSDWRLPFIFDDPCFGSASYSGGGCGWNPLTKSGTTVYSEMAHLYYETLGNLGHCSTTGVCPQPGYDRTTNPGPFSNVQRGYYWASTLYTFNDDPEISLDAWQFSFANGNQSVFFTAYPFPVWAVRSGDIAPVPVPAVGWLLCGAFAALRLLGRQTLDRSL